MLSDEQKNDIQQSVDAGRQVNRQSTGRVTLPISRGKKYVVLATAAGLTEAGQYYREITGAEGGTHGLGGDRITRVGNNEYMQARGGKRQLLRRLAPDGNFAYTRAGLKYFKTHSFFEYVVGVPVSIETTTGRQAGRRRADVLPVSKLGVSGLLQSQLGTEAERQARVKADVLRQLGVTADDSVIMEISGEIYTYEPEGEWQISRMATTPDPQGGTPITQVTLNRPFSQANAAMAHCK